MGSLTRYPSRHPWSPERPETLVICCSDGRYHPHIEEFVRAHVSERPDVLAVPGGPAALDPWASSFDHARVFEESLRLLFSSHDIRSVWLFAHAGCGFYKKKHAGSSEEERHARQIRDLHAARDRVRQYARDRYAQGMEVHLIHAGVDDGSVEFTEVLEPPAK